MECFVLVMELLLEVDVIDVLIDLILNGNMENVDVGQDIHYTKILDLYLNALLIKLVMMMRVIVTSPPFMMLSKEDAYLVLQDVYLVAAAMFAKLANLNLPTMMNLSSVKSIVEMD